MGASVNEEFLKERANTVRQIAELADPLTRMRLLKLAARYERAQLSSHKTLVSQPNGLGWQRSDLEGER